MTENLRVISESKDRDGRVNKRQVVILGNGKGGRTSITQHQVYENGAWKHSIPTPEK